MRHGGIRSGAGRKKGSRTLIKQLTLETKAKIDATDNAFDIKELAQAYAPAALKVLSDIMEGSENDTARVSSARELLDRGFGRPAMVATINYTASESLLEALRLARERVRSVVLPATVTLAEWTPDGEDSEQ